MNILYTFIECEKHYIKYFIIGIPNFIERKTRKDKQLKGDNSVDPAVSEGGRYGVSTMWWPNDI